jgi:hypothetical protein
MGNLLVELDARPPGNETGEIEQELPSASAFLPKRWSRLILICNHFSQCVDLTTDFWKQKVASQK